MSYVKLTKFPVTAPDGTEFRVKIEEGETFWGTQVVEVTLYRPRRLFRYRKLYCAVYHGFEFVNNPDYIRLTRQALADYAKKLERDAEERRKQAESVLRKQDAVNRLADWDGNIAEEATQMKLESVDDIIEYYNGGGAQ